MQFSSNGKQIQVINASKNIIIGEKKNKKIFAFVTYIVSFAINFNASANGCNNQKNQQHLDDTAL